MGDRMPKPDAQMQLNSIRATDASIRPAVPPGLIDPNEIASRDDRLLVSTALARIGLSHKSAAYTAGTHPSEWSNAMAGKGRLDFGWLWLQDNTFWTTFWPLVAEARALTPENARAVRRARMAELIGLLLEEAS